LSVTDLRKVAAARSSQAPPRLSRCSPAGSGAGRDRPSGSEESEGAQAQGMRGPVTRRSQMVREIITRWWCRLAECLGTE